MTRPELSWLETRSEGGARDALDYIEALEARLGRAAEALRELLAALELRPGGDDGKSAAVPKVRLDNAVLLARAVLVEQEKEQGA